MSCPPYPNLGFCEFSSHESLSWSRMNTLWSMWDHDCGIHFTPLLSSLAVILCPWCCFLTVYSSATYHVPLWGESGPVWNMSVSCTHWYRVLWFDCKNTPCSLIYTLSPTHGTIFRHYEIFEAWDLVGKWRPLWMDIGGSSLDWFWLHLAFRSTKKHGASAIYQNTHLSICSSIHL